MTTSQTALWARISNFQLDEADAAFKFSDRLARENGWTHDHALRVIDEYKKFIFLCCISPTAVTPSDPVDQAWHLHLTFTKSYWTDLCQNTLQQELHHNPTKGGAEEAAKFDECYTLTRDLYISTFESEPPAGIWQNNETRFSDIDFVRVNRRLSWIIRKPAQSTKRKWFTAFLVFGAIFSINAEKPFLPVVITLVAGILLVSSFVSNHKSSSNSGGCGTGGCGTAGCGGDSGHGSGCSSSGCSGCSSGCGGGCGS